MKFMRLAADGTQRGARVLSRCPFYNENGWLPGQERTAGSRRCLNYDGTDGGKGKPCFYDYGYSRRSFEINDSAPPRRTSDAQLVEQRRLHINMDGPGGPPGCLNCKAGQGDF